jgi:hypothetical protein
MQKRWRWQWFLFQAAVLVMVGGCSQQGANVSGKVTVDGKPLTPKQTGLVVSFVGKDSLPVTASVADDGTFHAKGVALGDNSVAVYWVPPPGQDPGTKVKDGKLPASPEGGPDWEQPPAPAKTPGKSQSAATSPIPEHYFDPNTSGLTFTVQPGQNTYNIDLKSK